jgi:hypothetical protein
VNHPVLFLEILEDGLQLYILQWLWYLLVNMFIILVTFVIQTGHIIRKSHTTDTSKPVHFLLKILKKGRTKLV